MINLSDRLPAHYSQRARTELSTAWEHLLTAAAEAARQVGDTSRTRGSVARERTALARLALRGQLPTSRWRWAAAGLAAGVVIGAVASAVLTRRQPPADPDAPQQPGDAPTPGWDKARTGTAVVEEPATAALPNAAVAGLDAPDNAGETVAGREPAAGSSPPTAGPAADSHD